MKAELNERNEVVVTMSRGESQRVANAAVHHKHKNSRQRDDCDDFGGEIEALGIEFIFAK